MRITFDGNTIYKDGEKCGWLKKEPDGHWWGELAPGRRHQPKVFTFIAAELHRRNEEDDCHRPATTDDIGRTDVQFSDTPDFSDRITTGELYSETYPSQRPWTRAAAGPRDVTVNYKYARVPINPDTIRTNPDSSDLPDELQYKEYPRKKVVSSDTIRTDIMTVCPQCGNKRCPKAESPMWVCLESNEPGLPKILDPLFGTMYAVDAPEEVND